MFGALTSTCGSTSDSIKRHFNDSQVLNLFLKTVLLCSLDQLCPRSSGERRASEHRPGGRHQQADKKSRATPVKSQYFSVSRRVPDNNRDLCTFPSASRARPPHHRHFLGRATRPLPQLLPRLDTSCAAVIGPRSYGLCWWSQRVREAGGRVVPVHHPVKESLPRRSFVEQRTHIVAVRVRPTEEGSPVRVNPAERRLCPG